MLLLQGHPHKTQPVWQHQNMLGVCALGVCQLSLGWLSTGVSDVDLCPLIIRNMFINDQNLVSAKAFYVNLCSYGILLSIIPCSHQWNKLHFIAPTLLFVVSHCYFAFTLMGMSNLFLLLHPDIKTQHSPSVEKRIVLWCVVLSTHVNSSKPVI